jgi:hypothetical protein
MSCSNCSHKLVCKYKPVSPCPVYPNDAALEECGTQPTSHNSAMLEIALCLRRLFSIVNQGAMGKFCDLESDINAVVAQLQQ